MFDSSTRRRLHVFAALHFLERVALVAAAFLFVRRGIAIALAVSVAVALLAILRGFVRAQVWVAVTATLHARVVDGLLRRELFRASPFDEDDPAALVFEAVDTAARVEVDHRPALVADGAAGVLIAVLFAVTQSASTLALGAGAAVVAGVVLIASRSRIARESDREWEAYRPVVDRVVASVHARFEVAANGSRSAFERGLAAELAVWQSASQRAQRVLGALGRAPLLVGGLALAAMFLLARSLEGGVTFEALSEAAVFGASLPPFAGIVRSLHELRKAEGRLALLAPWIAPSDDEMEGGSSSPAVDMIAWRDYSFRYPGALADALSAVSIAHRVGSLLVVVGDNGSGKSTLLKSLLGLGGEEKGSILAGDAPLTRDSAWRARVAYLPQRPYLGERTTARAALRAVGDAVSDDDARLWLERIGLWPVLVHKSPSDPLAANVGTLSSGERQRLALARFFARDRDVYLLDEPEANLDVAGIAVTRAIVADLAKTKLVVIAAHSGALVEAAVEVVRLEDGCLAQSS